MGREFESKTPKGKKLPYHKGDKGKGKQAPSDKAAEPLMTVDDLLGRLADGDGQTHFKLATMAVLDQNNAYEPRAGGYRRPSRGRYLVQFTHLATKRAT